MDSVFQNGTLGKQGSFGELYSSVTNTISAYIFISHSHIFILLMLECILSYLSPCYTVLVIYTYIYVWWDLKDGNASTRWRAGRIISLETAAGPSWHRTLEALVRSLCLILKALGSHWSVKIIIMRDKEARVRRLIQARDLDSLDQGKWWKIRMERD